MILLISLAIGFALGYLNLIKEQLLPLMEKTFNFIFFLMLVLLGAKMFSSQEVINNIGSIGLLATLFTISICLSSVLTTLILLKWFYPVKKTKQGRSESRDNYTFDLKQAFVPISAIVSGCIVGGIFPDLIIDYDQWIYWLMLLLIVGIGIDIGRSRENLNLVKNVGWLGVLIPLGALVGSMLGSLIFGLITDLPPLVSMAIGAGSGFYSVTAPLVAQAAGSQYGALALITNFLRESFTITLLPLITLRYNHLALVTIGGATTMDTTLPVIARSLGSKPAMIGLVQGIILSVVVPILLPFILNM